MISSLLLAVTIAFPKPGMHLPPITNCYVTGAVPNGVTNLVVQGESVPIYRTGAWATRVSVVAGTNIIEAVTEKGTTNVMVWVEAPPVASPPAEAAAPRPPSPPKVWEKLPYASDTPRPHPTGRRPCEVTIVVDAGHGGPKDLGAVSPHGFNEKDANLALAREVKRALCDRGFKVVMTRESDVAIPLTDRPRVAHGGGAEAFISLHHNAPAADGDPRTARWTSIYAWNPIGNRLAKYLEKRLALLLDGDIPSHGVLHANFAVTRSPEVPSCLVETDFLTSPEGEEAVWFAPRRRAIADALAEGVVDWLFSEE